MSIRFDFGHNIDPDFARSNMEFPISQPKAVRLPRNEKQTYWFNSRPQMWPMGLTLTITLTFEFWRSNMTLTFDHTHDLEHGFSWSNSLTMTIWWPGSGVWIYQIVTGVTLVVGVPSTHLVWYNVITTIQTYNDMFKVAFLLSEIHDRY